MKKGMFWLLPGALFFVVVLLNASSFAAPVNEGKWEVTTEVVMEGMPFKMPATKTTQCITKENMVPKNSGKSSNCKVLDQRVSGSKVSWRVKCVDSHGTTDGEGEITYSGDTYKGSMNTKMTDKDGKTQSMKAKYTGRRIGDCSAAEREAAKRQAEGAKGQAGKQ